VLLASLLAVPACTLPEKFELPTPASEPATEGEGVLLAGFDLVDITPPPGFGLFGYGPEGKRAVGYRTRLQVRALVLEDGDGQRIAFAVVDLGVMSTLVHRRVAQQVFEATDSAIGADRLILSATHTHSGPGHYLSAWTLNDFGSGVAGYDPEFVDWLTDGIADAVITAYNGRRPAKAAWAIDTVWGHTRNRSLQAYALNGGVPAFPLPPCPFSGNDSLCKVNPRWAMLRVDVRDSAGAFRPAGTLSIFAIHGTGFPSGSNVYDADIHGVVARTLESRLGGIHLFANGTQGDVSPNWPFETRCDPPTIRPTRRPGGPRTPAPKDDWHDAPEHLAACVSAAKAYVEDVGAALAGRAGQIYENLESELAPDVSIARAYETVDLTTDEAREAGLCESGETGTAAVAGGPDGLTRFAGFKLFGLIPLGLDPGGSGIDSSRTDCQGPKRSTFLPQSRMFGSFAFSEYAQFAVVRVGDVLIGTVPGEVTTEAGLRMLAVMQAERPDGVPAENLTILGLANGDLRYITTPEEYGAQLYEGGSNLYGPQTAVVIAERLRALTASLSSDTSDSGSRAQVDSILVRPGDPESHWPDSGPRPDRLRIDGRPICRGDTVIVRWFDAPAGSMVPASGPVLEFARERDGVRADDGDIDTEVRGRGMRRKGYLWEARWTPPDGIKPGDQFSLTLLRWEGPPRVRIRCD
jgi:neutral ceramidase